MSSTLALVAALIHRQPHASFWDCYDTIAEASVEIVLAFCLLRASMEYGFSLDSKFRTSLPLVHAMLGVRALYRDVFCGLLCCLRRTSLPNRLSIDWLEWHQ